MGLNPRIQFFKFLFLKVKGKHLNTSIYINDINRGGLLIASLAMLPKIGPIHVYLGSHAF